MTEVVRIGSVLHVRLVAPVDDWQAVFDSVSECLTRRPHAVALPAELPGGSNADAEMLKAMWESLMALGLTVYREVAAPDPLPTRP